jgi:O-methyltransferase involved in polyketide biosynthesis
MLERMRSVTDRWRSRRRHRHGESAYQGARHDVADYLEAHGWDTVGASIKDLSAASGLTPVAGDGLEDAIGWIVFVSASRR